jgi:hypothetical protein
MFLTLAPVRFERIGYFAKADTPINGARFDDARRPDWASLPVAARDQADAERRRGGIRHRPRHFGVAEGPTNR